jgi:hypothetical protein
LLKFFDLFGMHPQRTPSENSDFPIFHPHLLKNHIFAPFAVHQSRSTFTDQTRFTLSDGLRTITAEVKNKWRSLLATGK